MVDLFDIPQIRVPVVGQQATFPVRRVYCVGRNYAEHAREMGASGREPPFFFAKPGDAVVPITDGAEGRVAYPPRTANLHHEVELVVAIGRAAAGVSVVEARQCVFGYAIGVDLTRRDVQAELKKKGQPWEMGKAFDQSAPIGPIHPVEFRGHPDAGAIGLSVNGVERQRGDLADMIWSVPEVIAELLTYVELRPGDLIYSGTPSGVGVLGHGDRVTAIIAGLRELHFVVG